MRVCGTSWDQQKGFEGKFRKNLNIGIRKTNKVIIIVIDMEWSYNVVMRPKDAVGVANSELVCTVFSKQSVPALRNVQLVIMSYFT